MHHTWILRTIKPGPSIYKLCKAWERLYSPEHTFSYAFNLRGLIFVLNSDGGKLPNRVMVFADEIGTIPKIESMEMMFSAGRSRQISMVPIIQSFAQLQKNYGKEGSSIIIDNCQDILFGGFAPNSESAEILSKAHDARPAENVRGCAPAGRRDFYRGVAHPDASLAEMALRAGNIQLYRQPEHTKSTYKM